MSAALRARVINGRLVVEGVGSLPEGAEFDLVPVPERGAAIATALANDAAATLLDLLACDLPDDAFAVVLDRPRDLPRPTASATWCST